ncbi:MAG: hypothetical protein A2157_19010 [Deltaproteobacteria bacterium RBG_16_47_11]|nr:MAG: hypothetical protein A2157_19010 [Deltaproteobacteria bacterium RBG_16_47_11]
MRWARSYSIIDHQILHGRYLHRLSHESISLYLFLVVVLRLKVPSEGPRTCGPRTPTMAAGINDHVWELEELLCYKGKSSIY